MRVLVLASTYPRWPGDRQPAFIRDFCRHLPDCNVHVLVPGADGAAPEENDDGLHVHRFRYAPLARWQTLAYGGGILANVREQPLRLLLLPFFLAAMLFSAWRLARRERIDVVHAHWIIPQGVVGALLRVLLPRTRLMVTAHGGDAYAFNGRIGRRLKRRVLQRADTVTAVSTMLRDDLQRGLRLDRPPQVAPMGVDLARFADAVAPRQRRFCFVGRLVEKKGVGDLLLAYAAARAKNPDLPPLLIAGDGPLRPDIESTVARLALSDAVTLAGWQDPGEIPRLMATSLAVVVPSIVAADGDREGLGLVAVEALAAGTPVIAYDYGAIRDVITSRDDGLLVPQGDIEALGAALLAAAEGRVPAIGDVRRQEVRAHFDWQAVGRRYRRAYVALQ